MKKLLVLLVLTIFSACSMALADPKIDIGLTFGALYPQDEKVRETFKENFFMQGSIGLQDESGWELRGNLGHYGDTSHNPADLGSNLRIGITPLTASLIYHVNQSKFLQPYLGAGAGAYFYSVDDDVVNNIESGTKFGFHLLAGAKIKVNDSFYIDTEFNQTFIPSKIFFNNSKNFNTSLFTLGFGFVLPMNNEGSSTALSQPAPKKNAYKYTQEEEAQLVEIDQLTNEINEMKLKRKNIEKQIDDFYDNNTYDENSKEFINDYRRIKHLEKKVSTLDTQISEAQDTLRSLQQKWANQQAVARPVEEDIVYLRQHYNSSPYGLHRYNGYLLYRDRPYEYRFYRERGNTGYIAPNVINNNNNSKTDTVEEKKEYAEKKKQYIEKLKNR